MLQLKRFSSYKWIFVHPEDYNNTLDELDKGCSLYEAANLSEAENVFRKIVAEIPDHLDALCHLALCRRGVGDLVNAKEIWKQAVSMGEKAFPAEFVIGKDLLSWGIIDNRPFLRCLQGFGIALIETEDTLRANEIFTRMLKLNPSDNQGARAQAIETFFSLKKPAEVLNICKQYPGDCIPDTLYGAALACFQIVDRTKADKYLKYAAKFLPKVAKEILKDRHDIPEFAHPHHVKSGGEDEAYDYWERTGKYWLGTDGAVDWVGSIAGNKKKACKAGANIAGESGKKNSVVYQFKITLKDTKPPVWRRIQVPGNYTFWDLHVAIQDAMGWTDYHLHEFDLNNPNHGMRSVIGIPDEEGIVSHDILAGWKQRISKWFFMENKKADYTYDFGDGWEHKVVLEKILPRAKNTQYPTCVDGQRACPPEDCGSYPGYEDICNGKHEFQKEFADYDPEQFDKKDICFDDPKERLKMRLNFM